MSMVTMKNSQPFEVTEVDQDAESIRAQAQKQGYLFIKGLIPSDDLMQLRQEITAVCAKHHLLDSDRDPLEAIALPGRAVVESVDEEYLPYYRDIQKLRSFHAMAHHPTLIKVFEALFDESVLVLGCNICRTIFPNLTLHSTPPHQDHYYILGATETWTAWIPCGDCPGELGSLAIIPGSHQQGLLTTREASGGAGGRETILDEESVWACGDFACGDCLLVHSLCIHQGRDNLTADRIRFSLDFRYQPLSHPVHYRSIETPHVAAVLNWEEVYQNWPENDPLKYYWKDLPIKVETN